MFASSSFRKCFQKMLDRIGGPVLYKTIRVMRRAHGEEEISMMTTRTHKEHVAKWQPSAAMRGVCLPGRLSLAFVILGINTFNSRLGQETSIDSRYIRQ